MSPMLSTAMYPNRPVGLSTPVDSRTGVINPPKMPRIATTRASKRMASTNAAAVISDISRNVGKGPKNSK